MAIQARGGGSVQGKGSSANDSPTIIKVHRPVDQKLKVSVGTVMRVWRVNCVPMPHEHAAIKPSITPSGLPLMRSNSCQSNNSTPVAAHINPSQPMACKRVRYQTRPNKAENTGMV